VSLFLNISSLIAFVMGVSAVILAFRLFRRSVIDEHAKAELDAASQRFEDFDKSVSRRMREVSRRGRA
jgi:uncharacterized membrane-anchored protein YhcB (DUF1043 family)